MTPAVDAWEATSKQPRDGFAGDMVVPMVSWGRYKINVKITKCGTHIMFAHQFVKQLWAVV